MLNIRFYVLVTNLFLMLHRFASETVNTTEIYSNTSIYNRLKIKLNKLNSENKGIKFLSEYLYTGQTFGNNTEMLNLVVQKNWFKATNIIIEFMQDLSNETVRQAIFDTRKYINHQMVLLNDSLKEKKMNIIKLSPVFEWSQDNNLIKIRVRFAKNLETPGEKNMSDFVVNCTRNSLEIKSHKIHENYIAYYYRLLYTYDFIKPFGCKGYKETDGSYILKLKKGQPTLYWNYLNQINDDHHNTFTWFDVFDKYDGKVQYTNFRETALENLLMSDIEDFIKGKSEARKKRLDRIKRAAIYLRSKDNEGKNYCNTPVKSNFCHIPSFEDWSYWLLS